MTINNVPSTHNKIAFKFKASDEAIRALFKNIPIPTTVWQKIDQDFILVDYNDAVMEITGGKIDQLVGAKADELFPDIPDLNEELLQCFTQKTSLQRERMHRFLMSEVTKHFSAKYVFVPPDLILLYSEDITSRKETENNLKKSEKRYRELADLLPQAIFETDAAYNVTYCNQVAFEATGYAPEDVQKGLNIFKLLIPEDREKAMQNIIKVMKGQHIGGNEYSALRKDGTTLPINAYISPIIRNGKAIGLRSIITDISKLKAVQLALKQTNDDLERRVIERTLKLAEANQILEAEIAERQRMEEILRQSEEKHRAVIEQSADFIFLVDVETKNILEANPAFQKLLGYSGDELLKINLYDIIAHDRDDIDQNIATIVEKRRHHIGERKYKKKNGTLIDVEVSTTLISFNNKNVISAVARDITYRVRHRQIQGIIRQISDSILLTKNLNDLFQSIRRFLGDHIDTTNFCIAIHNPSDNSVSFPYFVDEKADRSDVLIDKTLIVKVIEQGQSILINPDFPNGMAQLSKVQIHANQPKSWLGVPLKLENRTLGAIVVQSYVNPYQYTKVELELLELAANQIALAVSHKKAEDELTTTHYIYREAIENAQGVPYRLNYSKNSYDILGKHAEELLGIDVEKISLDKLKELQRKVVIIDENYSSDAVKYAEAFRRGEISKFRTDFMVVTPPGNEKWISDCAVPIKDDKSGKVIGSLGILQDITERKRIEEALMERERFIENILNSLPANKAILNDQGEIVYVNKSWIDFARSNGLYSDLVGENYLSVCDRATGLWADEAVFASSNIRKVISGEQDSFSTEYPCHSERERRWFQMKVTRFSEPGPVYVVVSHRNITDLKLAEEALQASEQRYRSVVEDQTELICRHLSDGTLSFANGACCRFLNKRREELIGKVHQLPVPDQDLKVIMLQRSLLTMKNPVVSYEHQMIRYDGKIRWFHRTDRAIFDEHGILREYQSVARDISARKKAEEELEKYRLHLEDLVIARTRALRLTNKALLKELTKRQRAESALQLSKRRFELLYEENPSMYFTIDLKGKILSANKFGAEQLGYSVEELVGKSVFTVIYKEDKKIVQGQLHLIKNNAKQINNWEFRKICKDGKIIWVKESARLIKDDDGKSFILIVCEDISEKIKIQNEHENLLKQLAEREKLAILGKLTAAVTHEINNPLDIIMTKIDALKDEYPQLPEFLTSIEKIREQIFRINHLAGDIMSYAKPQPPKLIPLDINKVLLQAIEFLRAYRREGITIETKLKPNLPMISGDAIGLGIVFKNIILNAIQSIENQGTIVIRTQLVDDDQLRITIKDNGSGIEKSKLNKIFEQFYTSKQDTGGLGLGLTISLEIMKKHNGTIRVRSQLGSGTTFTIHLPVHSIA